MIKLTTIWYDATTGKHIRYGVAIAQRLRKKGYKIILTTRVHPDTIPLAEYLSETFVVSGKYDPTSALARLKEGVKRQLSFCGLFEHSTPDFAISSSSPDQCRTAFGSVPIIVTTDTPYADAVNRLTLPLADHIVMSKSIPMGYVRKYTTTAKIHCFDGVDEVAWIKGFKLSVKYEYKRPLIVVRPAEEKASYNKGSFDMVSLAKKLTSLGTVVFLSRYDRKGIKGLIVPTEFIDSVSLVAQADLFVGVGGTMSREAALLGIPSITIERYPELYVNSFLTKKGFPIFKTSLENMFSLTKKLLGRRYYVERLLGELENPVDTIESIVVGGVK